LNHEAGEIRPSFHRIDRIQNQAAGLVRSYLGATDPKNPLASPLYGDLTGLPPIRVHVGDDEVLLDDSRRYVERAVAAGVDASWTYGCGCRTGSSPMSADSTPLRRRSRQAEHF